MESGSMGNEAVVVEFDNLLYPGKWAAVLAI